MALNVEIERKFLILNRPSGEPVEICEIRKGYIAREGGNYVRIRDRDGRYILSIKTSRKSGGRNELEYEISKEEGEILFASINHDPIVKTRKVYEVGLLKWELDFFAGSNKGLIVAEVELNSLNQEIYFPDWIGTEVTDLSKFYNANLANMPFNKWRISYTDLISRLTD